MLLGALEEKAELKSGQQIFRKEIDFETNDPFDLLERVDLYPKWYWENREDTVQFASFGIAHSEREVPEFCEDSSPNIRFFGSFYYPNVQEPFWLRFSKTPFFLPRFEWSNLSGKITLASHFLSHEKEILPLTLLPRSRNEIQVSLTKRVDLPTFSDWKKNVVLALKEKLLEKVVLARRTSLTFQGDLPLVAIAKKLKEIKRNSYLFFYQPSPHIAFIGSSPEPLYRRNGLEIFSEAIAGTRKRGENPEEDERNRKELLKSMKEKREFLFVQEFLQNTLSPLCQDLAMQKEMSILVTPYVQHLHSQFQGRLLPEVSDSDLLKTLHPTPAILGTPGSVASRFLKGQERFARGLYTAPIGWINSKGAEFAVGIRSCFIENETAHLFAAAGIVPGSDPEKEWDELEQKIQLFKRGIFAS